MPFFDILPEVMYLYGYMYLYVIRETVMPFFEFLQVPLVIFMAVVAPLWILTHYVMRWRATKSLSTEDEKMLSELWESVPRMENRIKNLERILDAEVPNWREQL
jgi:phage shock protein B